MDDSRDTVIMRVPDEQLEGEDFIKFFSKAGAIKVTYPFYERVHEIEQPYVYNLSFICNADIQKLHVS